MEEKTTTQLFDLGKLAGAIVREARFRPIAQAIRDAQDAHSAFTDLVFAERAAARILTVQPSDNGLAIPEEETICTALFAHGVILYARATKTTQRSRKTFDLRKEMSNEQKILHRELVDLRDKAIAHFGTGGSYSGNTFVAETVVLFVDEDGARVGATTKRLVIDQAFTERFLAHIRSIKDIFERLRQEKFDAVPQMFFEHADNGALLPLIEKYPFDPVAFIGTEEGSREYLAGIGEHQTRGSVTHAPSNAKWLPDR